MIWIFLWQFPITVSPMIWHWGQLLPHLDQKVHHLLLSADISAKHVSCSRFGLDPRCPEQLDLPVLSVGFVSAQYHPSGEGSRQCLMCGCVLSLCFALCLLVPEGILSWPSCRAEFGKAGSFLSSLCPCPPTSGRHWWYRSFSFLVTVVAVTDRRNSTLWFLVLWVMLMNIVIAIFSGLVWKVIPTALNHDVHACPRLCHLRNGQLGGLGSSCAWGQGGHHSHSSCSSSNCRQWWWTPAQWLQRETQIFIV